MNFKNKNTNRILFLSFLLVIFSLNMFVMNINKNQNSGYFPDTKLNSINQEKTENPRASELDYYSKEAIKYGNFSDGWKPYWTNTSSGDITDVNASVTSTHANYEVLGDKKIFTKVANPPLSSQWTKVNNPDFPSYPDTSNIDSRGCYVSHSWNEGALQSPSVHWNRNESTSVNMSDYVITSASIKAIVNASVNINIEAPGDSPPQYATYDYVRFYVLISDLKRTKVYEIAYNQTTNLGRDTGPLTMTDTLMKSVPQESLIFFLTSVLNTNYRNFTIMMGMRIWCEDNRGTDTDTWTSLRIKSLNLTFTYEKKINQQTSLSWNQKGDGIFGSNKAIVNATLNFEHKIDYNWLGNTSSLNSEIRSKVNNIQLPETIKLSSINKNWQKAKLTGFDVTSFISVNTFTNLSIQVYIGDTFNLNKNITVSIDNVSLIIWYSLYTAPHNTKYDLFLNKVNKTLSKETEVSIGESVNITFKYKNSTNNVFLTGANVTLIGAGINTTLNKNPFFNQYNSTISTANLGFGDKYLTLKASKRLYQTQEFTIKISVVPRFAYINNIYLNGTNCTQTKTIDQVPSGYSLNITITYIDNITKSFISDAEVELRNTTGKIGDFDETAGINQYNYTLNTTGYQQGVYYLTIHASAGVNYTSDYEQIIVIINAKGTNYDLYLNRTKRDTIGVIIDQFVYVNFTYKDLNGIPLHNALVDINGSGISKILYPYGGNNYSTAINTTKLNPGNNRLDIFAQKEGFIAQSVTLWINLAQRPTVLRMYVNGTYMPALPPDFIISTEDLAIYEWYNITASYTDESTGNHIGGSTVSLNGTRISMLLNDVGRNYSCVLNSTDVRLNWGVNYLSIIAQKLLYEPQTVTIKITIIAIETNYTLFLNGTKQQNSNPYKSITLPWNENLNITVKFLDDAGNHINDATVDINGTGISYLLLENEQRYNITINTTVIGVGIKYLTIVAHKSNYEAQTIVFKVEVTVRSTEYRFILNSDEKTTDIDKFITLPWNENLNVTVRFLDSEDNQYISSAIVSINGTGISKLLTGNGQQYSVTTSTVVFGVGITYLTIQAKKDNYTTQTIIFRLEVIDISTDYQVFLNNANMTATPSINLPIGELLNITIKYVDKEIKNHIYSAMVNITGEGILESLNESTTLKQYSIIISTADLDIGVRYLTVFAQKDYYVSQSIKLTVEVKRIRTEITTVSGNTTINIRPGENANISIVLKNLDFGGRIKGARVNYTWELGQGALYDLDNDGVYQITLENVPVGTYTLTITVYASDDYDFERFRITINAVRPEEEVFWIYVLAGTGIAAAIGSGSYLIAYQKVLKYPKSIRKLRKFRNKLKRKSITGVEISSRESTITSLYQAELGKVRKLIKGKPEEAPQEMPDKVIEKLSEKPIEKMSDVKSDKTPDNPPNPI